MAADKGSASHIESSQHEAALTGALALANLFSNCVEAFGLIHPSHQWQKEEQLLLTRLGLEQARLLIWGDVVGISSPPKSVTDRAIPQHPSSAYPDLTEPTFFNARDERLEEPELRTTVENALGAIVDRSSSLTREEMMSKYGLKPPKRFASGEYQPTLDMTRLEAFREKFELLQEVAEDYAHIATRRNNSIVQTSWVIAENVKFSSFVELTKEKVDFLIELLDVKERVDRGMRVDIKGLGWHLAADKARVAADTSKLRLIQEVCRATYPEYLDASQTALGQIDREEKEKVGGYQPYASLPAAPTTPPPVKTNGGSSKRGGFFSMFRSPGKPSTSKHQSQSLQPPAPPRALSDAGVGASRAEQEETDDYEPIRSKSVGHILEQPAVHGIHDDIIRNRLERLNTGETTKDSYDGTNELAGTVSRHDQYHGLARTATKDLHQSDF